MAIAVNNPRLGNKSSEKVLNFKQNQAIKPDIGADSKTNISMGLTLKIY